MYLRSAAYRHPTDRYLWNGGLAHAVWVRSSSGDASACPRPWSRGLARALGTTDRVVPGGALPATTGPASVPRPPRSVDAVYPDVPIDFRVIRAGVRTDVPEKEAKSGQHFPTEPRDASATLGFSLKIPPPANADAFPIAPSVGPPPPNITNQGTNPIRYGVRASGCCPRSKAVSTISPIRLPFQRCVLLDQHPIGPRRWCSRDHGSRVRAPSPDGA